MILKILLALKSSYLVDMDVILLNSIGMGAGFRLEYSYLFVVEV